MHHVRRKVDGAEVVQMSRHFLVYGLRDPRTNEIRYVGKSSSGRRRPRAHISPSNLAKESTYKANWLRSLLRLGLRPEVVLLEEVADAGLLSQAEIRWIAVGRAAIGARFTNATDGGEGVLGLVMSPNARQKMSKAKSAAWQKPEIRERVLAAQNAGKRDPAFRRSMSKKVSALMEDTAHRERISNATAAAWADPVKRDRMSSAINAAKQKPEFGKKISAANKIALNRPEVKAKKRATMVARGLWLP